MKTKKYIGIDVLTATRQRIEQAFNEFERLYISFSGGKDSSVMFHLVMDEAIKRNRKVGVLIVDLEAQYTNTITHVENMLKTYSEYIEPYWVCLPISLSNAVSNFEPRWNCWDADKKQLWVRDMPKNCISDINYFDFFIPGMEFEEFVPLFGEWYSKGKDTCCFVGIRADESLNRFRTICTHKKDMWNNYRWTTKVLDNVYNAYPIYDWKTRDIWVYHAKNKDKDYNKTYDLMNKAGVPLSQQRLCQPFGSDQRKGLWLYHILEPNTWYKLLNRVNGVNSGALYIQETGNINGYNKISKPDNHTWESFFKLIFSTMPPVTKRHYIPRFRSFIQGWKKRGYIDGIPDEAPMVLENAYWAPSWRRMCKVLLRNDWWCKGLGQTQPKSEAFQKYRDIKNQKKQNKQLSAVKYDNIGQCYFDF
jgi:predicted phosphoadenosine phosphosulfate sulfurtransferase